MPNVAEDMASGRMHAALESLRVAAADLAKCEERLKSARARYRQASSEETEAVNRRNEALRIFEKARLALLTPEAARELQMLPIRRQ